MQVFSRATQTIFWRENQLLGPRDDFHHQPILFGPKSGKVDRIIRTRSLTEIDMFLCDFPHIVKKSTAHQTF